MPADIQTKQMDITIHLGELYFLTEEGKLFGFEIGGKTITAYEARMEGLQLGEYVGKHPMAIESVGLRVYPDPEAKGPAFPHLALVELSIREWYPNSLRLGPEVRRVAEKIIPGKFFDKKTRTYKFTVPQEALTIKA